MNYEDCCELLTSEQTIASLGFAFGLSQDVGVNVKTLKSPGRTFLKGVETGIIYAIGFGWLASACSRPYKGVLAVALTASIAYYQYQQFNSDTEEVSSEQ